MNIVGALVVLAVGLVWGILKSVLWFVTLLLEAAGWMASGAWDDDD